MRNHSEDEANQITPDDQNEKSSSASSKKLMILYVLEVLIKYSDQHHKLTQSEIIDYIKKDYDMDCERKAISRHIKALINHGYTIETYEDNGEGYYMKDLDFSSEDVFMLWEGMMASKYIDKNESAKLIKVLEKYLADDMRLGSSYYGGITNKYTYPETFIYSNLQFILNEMAMDKKIAFIYNTYAPDKTLEPLSSDPITVSPYAVLNIDNEYYLAAKPEDRTMMCYKVGLISDLTTVGFLSEDIRDIVGYAKGFDPQKFTADFIEGYGGTVTDFFVKIHKNKIGYVIENFGEEFKISHEENDILTLDIVSNFDKMLQWAISTAEFSEVIEPAAMRFKLKEFFDQQSWKYR